MGFFRSPFFRPLRDTKEKVGTLLFLLGIFFILMISRDLNDVEDAVYKSTTRFWHWDLTKHAICLFFCGVGNLRSFWTS
jgi:hypothetical protein